MNKKLLFAAMSLAALTACTDNDFESQKVAEEVGSVQFEILNNNDAFTRASMSGNKVVWSANDGDLFTLYHGAALGSTIGHENAIYTAKAEESKPAVLTTPSMIKAGGAVMVWPADTTFHYDIPGKLTVQIPDVQGDTEDPNVIANQIPYVSDEINIAVRGGDYNEDATKGPVTAWNQAGKDRKYPVFMRPMASQLNLKADIKGMELLTALVGGDDPIDPIKLTSVDLLTTTGGGTTDFTQEIAVTFAAPSAAIAAQWATVAHSNWNKITNLDATVPANIVNDVDQLTTKHLNGNESCKFLILPQNVIAVANPTDGVADAAVVVNTIYGKVVVAPNGVHGSKYNTAPATGEIEDAWYRYVSGTTAVDPQETKATAAETSGEYAGKFKTTSAPALGMAQTINAFSANLASSGVVEGEYQGAVATRFVKVLLKYLDMSDLHIKNDKQLRNAAKVWKALNLAPVTVYLDGDANKEFEISQQTIAKINEINAGTLNFKVKPCRTIAGEVCNTIVIKDGGNVPNIAFIADNGGFKADVVLKAGATWTWAGSVDVTATGVAKIINKGAMQNTTGATLKTKENGTAGAQNNVPFENATGATWTVSGGELNVQFNVTNYGTLTINAGAEYRQAKGSANTTFINEATAVPSRFTLAAAHDDAKIGKVHNSGVFATLAATGSEITNYGEIYHDAEAAKTYITNNQSTSVNFANAFADPANKMGMIILPYNNKDEDNISVKAALNKGFVAVAINADNAPSDGILSATTVGERVNYIKIDGGIHTVADMPATQIKYVEFNSGTTEIDWAVTTAQTYDGMMVLSPVNVKLGTTITVSKATYLGANMYVGGTFNKGSWSGYFGNTSANEATKYITF